MNKLPEGWIFFELGEITTIAIGKTPPRGIERYFKGDKIWLSIRDLQELEIDNSKEKLTEEAVKRYNINLVKKGTLLMSFKLTLGKMAFAKTDLYTNEAIAALPIKSSYLKKINSKFLYYSLQYIDLEGEVDNAVKGKTLNKEKLKNLKIPIAPIAEQKEIVTLLDMAFHKLNLASTRTNESMWKLRQMEVSILNNIFESNNSNWKQFKLSEKFKLHNGRAYNRNELLTEGKYKVIRIQNLNGGENWYYSDMELGKEKYCENGDLLYSWSGTPGTSFGAFIWKREKAIFHYHIWRVELDQDLDKNFAFYLLKHVTDMAISQSHGVTGMMHISKGKMENLTIKIPEINEQKRIVRYLDQTTAKNSELLKYYQTKLKAIQDLKSSILNSAFKGELRNSDEFVKQQQRVYDAV